MCVYEYTHTLDALAMAHWTWQGGAVAGDMPVRSKVANTRDDRAVEQTPRQTLVMLCKQRVRHQRRIATVVCMLCYESRAFSFFQCGEPRDCPEIRQAYDRLDRRDDRDGTVRS